MIKIWKNGYKLETIENATQAEAVARCDTLANANPTEWVSATENGVKFYKACIAEGVRIVE